MPLKEYPEFFLYLKWINIAEIISLSFALQLSVIIFYFQILFQY